jgi:hypothetical protein
MDTQNKDILASALMRRIHPLDNIFKMADVQGVNASNKHTGEDHGVSILMTNHGVAAVTLSWLYRPSVTMASVF